LKKDASAIDSAIPRTPSAMGDQVWETVNGVSVRWTRSLLHSRNRAREWSGSWNERARLQSTAKGIAISLDGTVVRHYRVLPRATALARRSCQFGFMRGYRAESSSSRLTP
jgi:hypothetical protein